MITMMSESLYFGVVISLLGYFVGGYIKKKINFVLFNPLLIAIIFVIVILKLMDVSYETYNDSAKYMTYFLTPATICLAIPLYRQLALLKDHFKAVVIAITSGVIVNMSIILGLSMLFNLDHGLYVTLLPKSITTAIAIGLTTELGGQVTITIAAIIVTGLIGNVFSGIICKMFKITEPIAIGLAIGTSAHALGTAKAIELGEVEGAMGGLAIVITGVMTVLLANVYAILL